MADFSVFSDGTNNYNVKDSTARSNLSTHEGKSVSSEAGSHDLRYYNGTLSYKSGNDWTEVDAKDSTARSTISTHSGNSVNSETGSHDIRYYEGTLSYKSGNSWNEIKTGAGVVELTQQQYNALPTSDKNSDVIYIITDAD